MRELKARDLPRGPQPESHLVPIDAGDSTSPSLRGVQVRALPPAIHRLRRLARERSMYIVMYMRVRHGQAAVHRGSAY